MGNSSIAGRYAFRNDRVPNVPGSGENEPDKAEIRAVFDVIDREIAGMLAALIADGFVVFATVAAMNAASGSHASGVKAFVYGDPDPLNDDVWIRLIVVSPAFNGWIRTGLRSGVQVDGDGYAVTNGVLLNGVQGTLDRSAWPFLHWLAGPNGLAAIGVDGEGKVTERLSDRSLRDLEDDRFDAALPRGFLAVANVRRGRKVTYATASRNGRVFDVVQRNYGLFNTALVAGGAVNGVRTPIDIIAVFGQSNAGIGPQPKIVPVPLYPEHVVGLNYGDVSYGTALLPYGNTTDLIPPEDDPAYGNAPGHLIAWACAGRDLADGVHSPGYVTLTSWEGSQPIASFQPGASGHSNFANLMTGLAYSASLPRAYGRPAGVCREVIYIQGENATGFDATTLGTLIDNLQTTIPTQTGQSFPPKVYLYQTNDSDTATSASGVELVQLAVAKARAASGVVLATPMYPAPLYEEVGTDVHGTELGRMVLADIVSVVKQRIDGGGSFAFWPTGATRTTTQIDVVFTVPDQGLAFDTTWIGAVANKGFRAFLISSGAELTISSVTILNATTVRIVLSANPGGPVRIEYARNNDSADDGWASGRGQLISPTGQASVFYGLGYAVPPTVNHYCPRFSQDTAS